MILFLSTADTEILSLRQIVEGLPDGFPAVRAANPVAPHAPMPELAGVDCVLVRLLGGRRAWQGGLDRLCREASGAGIPLLAFGGEAMPDEELTALSTVPSSTVLRAFDYLACGGLANLTQLLRFVADTVLGQAWGFDSPMPIADVGIWGGEARVHALDSSRPTVGVVFYRAHLLSGNTAFVEDLVAAIEARGANALPVWCYSLRREPGSLPGEGALDVLRVHGVAAIVTTVLAMGSAGDDGEWDVAQLEALGVPVVQAIAATQPHDAWRASSVGLAPIDVAMAVAIPEFDGRVISVPFSFKEIVDDGDMLATPISAYRTVPDRTARVTELAVRLVRLGRRRATDRRIALVLSAYPTKASRIGNAVGLDTPASVVALLTRMQAAGYVLDRIPVDGDALMAELAEDLGATRGAGRWPVDAYRSWFSSAAMPAAARDAMCDAWGEPPGDVGVTDGDFVFTGLDLGGVFVAVQPPRGFGANPVAVYHSPDLAPTHHYVAFYRWLDEGWGADAIVHVGKHGTLEWLPGKGVGLSWACFPDVALGSMPVIYPFVVNDPGEGTQAKRRAHAVIVDHLVPPMTRAETYDDLARLEALLDAYAQTAALDPTKLPALREQVWELIVSAELHRDLGWDERPAADSFDDALVHLDGYLCELKDAQIRGGLHVLGEPPRAEALLELVLALTRLPQGSVPSLRETMARRLGTDDLDAIEAACRAELEALQAAGWSREAAEASGDPTLAWVARWLVPALERTTDELGRILDALEGRYVPAGPAGAPTRGMAHVLPTGRNFYSLDPKAVPTRLAWDVGSALAQRVVERHLTEEGCYPETVGLVIWGTAAMRTGGDDVAEGLALLGVRPVWETESGRVRGLEVIELTDLGRPRIDVTVRISGFFRDAFPHVVALLDDAVALVAGREDEAGDRNFVRAHGADPRIFGSKPGAYGSGILALLESGDWRDNADLAAVYEAWSGYSYGRAGMGREAHEAMRRRFAAIDVALKNQDNREHDIFDSDDYLQDHGGMVATVRSLTGQAPKAWFGDSADPAKPRVRTLAEEAARVVRTRVLNPKWITAMQRHGYKGAFEMAATVDYLFGYDATAQVVEDWMYERVTEAYVGDAAVRKFFAASNPWALRSIAERLLEATERGLWDASAHAREMLQAALLEAEGWEEDR